MCLSSAYLLIDSESMNTQKTYSPKAVELLDAAELHMRRGGFDAFSFRELAKETGIKSSSVHYYFPQKGDLAAEVVARYRDKILSILGEPEVLAKSGERALVERLVSVYRAALIEEDAVCLCAMLGAELDILPDGVADEVARFYDAIMGWIKTGMAEAGDKNPAPKASMLVSSLVGAMTVTIATKSQAHFNHTADCLLDLFP